MPIWLPNQGETAFLTAILAVNYSLRLYKNNVTLGLTTAQKEALTESSFTEATFTGYSAKGLTGGSWTVTAADPTTGTYAQQTFTSTANQTAQTIYGYYVTRTSDGKLMWFEDFTGPLSISLNGDNIQVTPTLTLDDNQGATVAARGIIAYQVQTANSSGYTASGATDFSLANCVVDSTRNYEIHLHSWWSTNAAGTWIPLVLVDGVQYARMASINPGGASYNQIDSSVIWQPPSGTNTLSISLAELGGTSTLVFEAASGEPRQFWLEDVGPR